MGLPILSRKYKDKIGISGRQLVLLDFTCTRARKHSDTHFETQD